MSAPPPAVSTFTRRLYDRLPELYRAADEDRDAGPNGYPLLRFLSLLLDQAGELETIIDRIDYVSEADGGAPGDTSELVDPALADARWLPWLAQLVGVNLGDVTDPGAQRVILERANANRANGSLSAMAAQIAPLLTGARYVSIVNNYNGDPWHVAILTLGAETTATSAQILEAAGRQKPAGVYLSHQEGLTWEQLETGRPTWGDVDAAGSWAAL